MWILNVVVSSQDGWESTRFKAVNTTTFYPVSELWHRDSNAHAHMYKTPFKLWHLLFGVFLTEGTNYQHLTASVYVSLTMYAFVIWASEN